MSPLSDNERAVLLEPCDCGHTINDHGNLINCWPCDELGNQCGTNFEDLLAERMTRMINNRTTATDDETPAGGSEDR
jgi:hypothetical protein